MKIDLIKDLYINNELIKKCYNRLLEINIKPYNIILHGSKVTPVSFSEIDILIIVSNKIECEKSSQNLKQLKSEIWVSMKCILDFTIIEKSLLDEGSNTSLYFNRILNACQYRLYGKPAKLSSVEMQEVLDYKFQSFQIRFPQLKFAEKVSLGIFLYLINNNISFPSLLGKSYLFDWFEGLNNEDADYLLIRDLVLIIKNENLKFLCKIFNPNSNKVDKLNKFIEGSLNKFKGKSL